jgi:hypothetical protein
VTALIDEIEQVPRSGRRHSPVPLAPRVHLAGNIAWTDETLDDLAEQIAQRIRSSLPNTAGGNVGC